jgi:hypothetical protein
MELGSGILLVGVVTIIKMRMKIHITARMINTINRIVNRKRISSSSSSSSSNNITLTNNSSILTIPTNNSNNNNTPHHRHHHQNHREHTRGMNLHNLKPHKMHIINILPLRSIHHKKKRETKMISINLIMIVSTIHMRMNSAGV